MDGSHRLLLRPIGERESRVTATADTQRVSLYGSSAREKGGRAMCVRIFVFLLEIFGEAQHHVKQRVEHAVQASGK